jgi:hypothetical protein
MNEKAKAMLFWKQILAMSNLIDGLDAQLRLIDDELNETAVLAYVHGWRSTRIEQGKQLIQRIKTLRGKVRKP